MFKYPNKTIEETSIAGHILSEIEKMKTDREPMETEWNEAANAYQTIIDEFKRMFDVNKAPELQFRNYYSKHRLSDIRLPVEFSIIQRKLTYIMSNIPKPSWISVNMSKKQSERQATGKMFKYIFDYVWYLCDGDFELFKTIIKSLIYSIGYIHWWHEYSKYDCEVPDTFENGEIVYKKVTKVISRTRVEDMDPRHVFLDYNASDISGVMRGAFIKHYSPSKAKQIFGDKIKDLLPITPIECFLKPYESKSGTNKNVYEAIYWYDEVMDRYAIVINGQHINRYEGVRINTENTGWSPIPSDDKKFPIAFFIDHFIDGSKYGMGECKLAKPLRIVKNNARNLIFDVMKKIGFQTLIIDPLSDFDEEEYEFGQPFIRAAVDDIKPLPVSANLDVAVQMYDQTDNDVAQFTGINISDTGNPTQNETATKTAVRRESQLAIIENYLKFNTPFGFKRLWLGMKNTIRIAGKVPEITEKGDTKNMLIMTDGVKLFRKGSTVAEQSEKGSWVFETKPEDFDDDMELVLQIGNIAYTKELEDEKKREGITKLMALAVPGGPVNGYRLAQESAQLDGLPEDIVNTEPAKEQGDIDLNKSPEEITKNLDLAAKPPSLDELFNKNMAEASNPEAGTPSQRTSKVGTVPGIQATPQTNPAIIS
jgi:hypothetical protein